jgi:ABC-type polysaccharide/polyol phosphate export permease
MILAGFDRRDFAMLKSLFRMNLGDRFLGSTLGLIWAVLSPLMLMGIFCFVFSVVFPGRLQGKTGTIPYLIWLVSGYGPWLAVSEGLVSATNSVVGNSGVVKNIAFKSEILPIVGALMGLVPLLVSMALVLVLQLVGGEAPKWTLIALPFAMLIQLVFISGIGMFLAALNVFVRDTALILPNFLTMILFASPIFYVITAYPAPIRAFLAYNPFYILAELYRVVVVDGELPTLWMVSYMVAVSIIVFVGGLWWFRRLKSFFDTRL